MFSLVRLLAVMKKETREILRDPITLWIAILLPVIMMILFSYAITLDVKEIPLAVLDEDGSPESRDYIAAFLQSGYFRLHTALQSEQQIERLLDNGAVRVALVIPVGFSRSLAQGIPADVETLVDGSFANTAVIALNYVDAINESYARQSQERAVAGHTGFVSHLSEAIRVEPRIRYNPDLRSENFIIPGLFAVILMAFPPLLTALAVVREHERGSILQLYISPIRAWEFLGGKLLPYAAIAFFEMVLLLILGSFWFKAPIRGSVPLLLILSFIYVICTVGIGLLISTTTRSQVVAILLAIVLTFMPSFLFSGFLFSIDAMPKFFQWYTHLFPARHFMEIARGISLKGVGLERLWPNALLLIAYGTTVLTLASLRFKKKLR